MEHNFRKDLATCTYHAMLSPSASSPGPFSFSFSILHAEKREGLVHEVTCAIKPTEGSRKN